MSDQLPWKDYSGETAEQLIELQSSYRIDSLVVAFYMALSDREISSASKPERVVIAVEVLEMEVNNGGFSQFFANSQPEVVSFVVEALSEIDCLKVAAITKQAIEVANLPEHFTKDDLENELSPEAEETLHQLDEEFYDYPEPVAEKLFAYIVRNVALLRIP